VASNTSADQGLGRPLSRSAIVAKALDIVDSDGLAAVSLRRLARELGVTPMSLYRYVQSKEDLLSGIADAVLAGLDLSMDAELSWWEQLRSLLRALVDVLAEHPSVAPLLTSSYARSLNGLRALEALLDILRRAGFSPARATELARWSVAWTIALTALQAQEMDAMRHGDRVEAERRYRLQLQLLPAAEFPRIIEAAAPLSTCPDPRASAESGLDLLLEALKAAARPQGLPTGTDLAVTTTKE
jgi:AcrR family transcriptional regulator